MKSDRLILFGLSFILSIIGLICLWIFFYYATNYFLIGGVEVKIGSFGLLSLTGGFIGFVTFFYNWEKNIEEAGK